MLSVLVSGARRILTYDYDYPQDLLFPSSSQRARMTAFSRRSLQDLKTHTVATFRSGAGSRPDVLRVRVDDRDAVLKDHNGCDRWFSWILGPVLTWRETRALKRLRNVAGVPELYAVLGPRALLIEYLPGIPITRADNGRNWADFFARLEALLDEMHRHGVAHCDLRSPTNTLLGDDNRPYLVDFVGAVLQARSWNPIGRWIFDQFCVADRHAVMKLKALVAPELLTEREHSLLRQPGSALEKTARWLGSSIRDISRSLFTKRSG